MALKSPIIQEKKKICEFIINKSESIYNLIKNDQDWNYMLIVKNITHSDLINLGKRCGTAQGIDKNYLYYLTVDEMKEIEKVRNKKFETAKQSNIFMPLDFYNFLEIPQLQRREGSQSTNHNHIKVNDYANVYLVNDTLKYFNLEYTKKVFKKLNKNPSWDDDDYKLNSLSPFTPVQITHAIHGLGTSEDDVFKKLRRSIFRSDTLIVLLRKKEDKKEVYVMLEKNPRFFTIIGENNLSWENYLNKINKIELYNLLKKDALSQGEIEKTRKNQSKWRNLLADEMMSYTANDDEIFCPLTYITAKYSSAGQLCGHGTGDQRCCV